MDFPELWDRLASILFPQRCLFCDEVVAYEDFWCGGCVADGKAPRVKLGRVECDLPSGFTDALAAVEYAGDVRKLIWRLKDKSDSRILQFFAGEMRSVMSEYWGGIRFDMLVPVPSTASRLKERGFNQAEKLARCLSRKTGIPMRGDALIRREGTRVQRDLPAPERHLNAEKSYGAGNTAGVEGKAILLVDDVFTTGSTAAACSGKLLAAGADKVYVVTASGTGRQKRGEASKKSGGVNAAPTEMICVAEADGDAE